MEVPCCQMTPNFTNNCECLTRFLTGKSLNNNVEFCKHNLKSTKHSRAGIVNTIVECQQTRPTSCMFPFHTKVFERIQKNIFYMFPIAIYNAYVLHSKLPPSQKHSIVNFRLNIIDDMLCNLSLPKYSIRGRPTKVKIRLDYKQNIEHIFLNTHISTTNKKQHSAKRCHVSMKHNIKSETTWQCKTCLVPLHILKYFEKYHTLKNY